MIFSDIIGLAGVFLTLLAYFLLSIQKVSAQSLVYTGGNAAGSLLVIYSLYYHWNLSAFTMEFCWLLISLYGVWAVFKKI